MVACLAGVGSAAAQSSAPVDWSGFYAGFNAGAAIGTAKMSLDPSGTFLGPTAEDIADGNFWRRTTDLDSTGPIAGLQAGYQVRQGRFLFGLEAELGYLGLRDSASVTATVPSGNGTYRLDQEIKTDVFASLRPRLGYVPEALSGNLMLFATAGLAVTHARIDQTLTQLNIEYNSDGLRENRMLIGWTAGGGFEYALSNTWRIKTEYLYADFGSVTRDNVTGNPAIQAAYTTNNRADLTTHIVRLGANFRF
jgi:outer membrane immunogenic protein